MVEAGSCQAWAARTLGSILMAMRAGSRFRVGKGHAQTRALEDGCGCHAEHDSRKAIGKEERRERLWLSGKTLANRAREPESNLW